MPDGIWKFVGKLTIGERFDGGTTVVVAVIGVVNNDDEVLVVVVVVLVLVLVIDGILEGYSCETVLFGNTNITENCSTLDGGWFGLLTGI